MIQDKLQAELEKILVHTTDHQKKIAGELTFLQTGDYPSDDISNRPMPSYQQRVVEPKPTTSNNYFGALVFSYISFFLS